MAKDLAAAARNKNIKYFLISFVDLLGLEEARKQADNLIAKACDSLESYGAAGDGLRGLAHFVINRNH